MIYPLQILDVITVISMFGSIITFFTANRMDPGYVKSTCDFNELLEIGNDRCIDLENFCFYCKLIKSTRTFHCMVCGKCVEKFDHHCVYINNCLGYRNHKYFMFFLGFIGVYIVTSSAARIIAYFLLDVNQVHGNADDNWVIFTTIALIYTLVINALIMIPLS